MLTKSHSKTLEESYNKSNLKLNYKVLEKETLNGDIPFTKVRYHWYDPINNNGSIILKNNQGLLWFQNAKDHAVRHYEKAVKHYINKNYKKSSEHIAIVLHIICDLSIPAHVNRHYHYFRSDIHELYIDNNLNLFDSKKININDINRIYNIESLIEELAWKSTKFKDIPCSFYDGFLFKYFKIRREDIPKEVLARQCQQIVINAMTYSKLMLGMFEKEVRK